MDNFHSEFGDWHFHRFWRQLLELNSTVDTKGSSEVIVPKEYTTLSFSCIDLLLASRNICILARTVRGEKEPLDKNFFTRKESEELAELEKEIAEQPNVDVNKFSIEKAIIQANNKIVRRCLANFEGDFNPKIGEK